MSASRRREKRVMRTIWCAAVESSACHTPPMRNWWEEVKDTKQQYKPKQESWFLRSSGCVGERGLQGWASSSALFCQNHAHAEGFIGYNNHSVNHPALLCSGGFFNWLVHLDSTINITELYTYRPENVSWTFGALLGALPLWSVIDMLPLFKFITLAMSSNNIPINMLLFEIKFRLCKK